jgi:hypothetical protein
MNTRTGIRKKERGGEYLVSSKSSNPMRSEGLEAVLMILPSESFFLSLEEQCMLTDK